MDWLAEQQMIDAGRGHLTRNGAAAVLNARDLRDENPPECEGHPAGPFDPMGETVYCDGTCQPRQP